MNRVRPHLASNTIFVDEIGIEIGVFGEFRLKTAYQPIFSRRGESLVPVAVEGVVRPFHNGQPVAPADLRAGTGAADRLFVDRLCGALHVRNYRNIGVEGLELFFNFDPGVHVDLEKSLNEIRFMAQRLDDVGLMASTVVCEIVESEAPDALTLLRLVREIRACGMRIAIDNFGAKHSRAARVKLLRPEFVKIDGLFFREVCALPAALQLFPRLVRALKADGARVLIEGIENAAQLRAAVESGTDLFQGFHLARPALAGAIFEGEPRTLDSLLETNLASPRR